MMQVLTPILLTVALFFATPVLAQDTGMAASEANREILLQKIKADKKLLVAANMDLTDAEAKSFWPLYDGYQKELNEINESLVKTIKDYAEAYNKGPIEDSTAKKLLDEALSAYEAEIKLKRVYAMKIGKVLPAAKTARYIQMENKIRAILNAELANQIPLAY